MRCEIVAGRSLGDAANAAIERFKAGVERLCREYDPDDLELQLSVEERAGAGRTRVSGVLTLPEKRVQAEYSGPEAEPAVIETCRRLERELKRYRAQQRSGERGAPRREFQDTLSRSAASDAVKEEALTFLERNLPRFYNYAYREIRSRVYQGYVRPGDIAVRDVLDEAVLELLEQSGERFDAQDASQLLYRAISRVVVRETNARLLPQSHLEELLENADIDTELYEYYQPDEVEWLEEVVPDLRAATPDEAFELAELERRVETLVSQLPRQWRESFVLTTSEGFSVGEAALIQGREASEVKHDIEMARAFLKQRLAELGVTGPES